MLRVWRLGDTEDSSSGFVFDSTSTSYEIMNILIWNCKGAMKPQFRKTMMDLVEWHSPILMVITETRLSGARVDEIIESLPLDGVAVADSIWFAGGIWMLCRSDLVQVEVLSATEQEIHSLIQVRSQNLHWLISVIYASLRFEERCILWNNLRILANMHDLPWALMGDFNEVLSKEEKYGRNPICQRRVRAIKECMDDCNMMDLGFSSPKFTWTNKRELGNLIQCRLDRCWVNSGWKDFYPEANVTHLARVNSDHCPLLLNLTPSLGSTTDRPFRFQTIWLSHSDFPVVMRDAWVGREGNIAEAITDFKIKAQRWNRKVFGNVFIRKKQVMARFSGTQRALTVCPNSFLIKLQDQLTEE